MSKESLDCQKLCSNYYSSWEEGCCMESCEFYNHNECPVVYVNGLISDLEAKLAESQHKNQEFISKYRYWRGECAELNKQLAEKDIKLHEYIRCALEDYNDNQKEIIELKQQLAEKDQAIEEINKEFVQAVKDWKSLVEQKNKDIAELEEHDNLYHNQLAIEQLEKVKNMLPEENIPIYPYEILRKLINQIEELKKDMK